MATINLVKGEKINLQKGISKFRIGLSWDAPTTFRGNDFDLDAWAIGLDNKDMDAANILTKGDAVHFTFYNNLQSFDKAITHSGDNRNGDGEGDDETITLEVGKLDPKIKAIIIGVTIHEAESRNQNFGQVRNPKVKLYTEDSDIPELVYELDEDYSTSTCVEFCKIYEHNGNYKFEAVGLGNTNDLTAELLKYHWPVSNIQN